MHIPDGMLTERVFIPLAAVTLAGVALASARARRDLEERPGVLPLTGVMGAFIFAAQMVNFPLPVPGVSGHLLGGVLAGILLGPYCATIAMASVFIIQALLFGDGGVTALGANAFNMGLIATFLGYGLYRAIRAAVGERFGLPVAAFSAGFASVVLGAFAAYLEIAASKPEYRGTAVLSLMLGYHAVIGVFEGVITVGVLGYIRRVRPDLVALDRTGGPAGAPPPSPWPLTFQMALAALVVGLVLARFKSERPDGLEAVKARVEGERSAGAATVPGGPDQPAGASPTANPR